MYDTFGQPLIVRWRTERAKQVFVYLLLHANQAVPRDILLDVFWEGYDQTKAAAQLHTTVYLIRKTLAPLENEIQLQTGNGLYTLQVPHHRVDLLDFRALVSKIADTTIDFNVKEIRDLRIIGSDVLIDISEVWIEPFRAMIEQSKEEFMINIMSRYARPKQMNETERSACRLIVADYMHHVDDEITVVQMLKRGLTLNGVQNPDAVIQEFIIQREK
jgi:two-component SAPR family response regulator